MKKIGKAREKVRLEGNSFVDGISIRYSKTTKNKRKFHLTNRSVVKMDDDGNIRTEFGTALDEKRSEKAFEKIKKLASIFKKVFLVLAFLMVVTTMVMLFVDSTKTSITIGLIFVFIGLSIIPVHLAIFILGLFQNEDVKSLKRYHAAEHAVLNAYNKTNEVPTLSDIRTYSSFSSSCGSLEDNVFAILFIGLGIGNFFYSNLSFLIFITLFYLLVLVLAKLNLLSWTEAMVLSKPTDNEYIVAIKALEAELLNESVERRFGTRRHC